MTTLNNTLECLIDGIGQATGEAIKSEINALLAMPNVDISALQAAIAQIQDLLDADPGTTGFQTGQSIIAQLVALGNRLDNIENSTVLATLQVLVSDINNSLVSEIADRVAADAVNAAAIEAAVASITELQATVATLEAAGSGGSCDCVAISAQIASMESSLANLVGTDAAQAAQIAGLQSSLTSMASSVAAATAAANAATAAATAATSAAATATAATTALAATVAALSNRENDHHSEHHGRLNDVEGFRAGIEAIDCTALVARFRSNVTVGLAG